jgi:DNA topoisomerase-1
MSRNRPGVVVPGTAPPEPRLEVASAGNGSRMPSLRHSSDREPGYTRRRHGKGWRYLDTDGRPVTDPKLRARFESLVIPPAWTDVWICKSSRGHLQATGTDDAGRRQYLYHPKWHEQRQVEKYERILRFADGLPNLRRVTAGHLRRRRLDREKAMAAAVRLLDRTNIRLGGESYAKQHGTYGLATLRSKHLDVDGDTLVLDFNGKGGINHHAEVTDARLARVVAEMDELPGYEVFKYLDEHGEVVDVRSGDVNAYIKEVMGEDFSAKDFRTWAGTVAAAVALSEVGPIEGATARQRAVSRVCKVAAELLGNTPAVSRASYIDPRVIDHFLDGTTIASIVSEVESRMTSSAGGHSAEELAVLALLRRGLEDRRAAA